MHVQFGMTVVWGFTCLAKTVDAVTTRDRLPGTMMQCPALWLGARSTLELWLPQQPLVPPRLQQSL